jgi:hypothetical protein
VEARLGRIEDALRPSYLAMPKNTYGRLDHATARYAMHRLFVNRHGWFVLGLEPGGGAWSDGSPAGILQDRLPDRVQEIFERRLGDHGLDLSEVAVLAAVIENMVQEEAVERLRHTYRLLNRSVHDPLDLEESHEVVDMYMAGYVLGFNFSDVDPAEALSKRNRIQEAYPTWPETVKFLRAVQAASTPPQGDELVFEHLAAVIEEVGDQYGRWQDEECRLMKNDLMKLEDRGSGRVRLAEFYRAAVKDGNWQFSESVDYLRELGALDESDTHNMRVLIPNYISSPTNCVASSKYYSVCCLDECEELFSHLEQRIGSPEATQKQIAELVAALPSATVPANRTLSAGLVRKLEEIAQHHGNSIPLHGRLFKQWMHVAYPRECSFPHVTGTTSPQRAVDWMTATGQEIAATTEEMAQHMETSPRHARPAAGLGGQEEDCGLWTMEEELVSVHVGASEHGIRMSLRPALRGLFFAFAAASASLAALRSCWAVLEDGENGKPPPEPARFHL